MKTHAIPDGSQVYWDGRHYDADNSAHPGDLSFYLAEAKKDKGPILELACGTGRLAIPLAKAGLDITGLDVAAPMLAQAREKARNEGLKVRFVLADARKFSLRRKFGLVFIAFSSMQHLHDRASLESFFGCVRRHLAPGGRFILDVFNPDPRYLVRDGKELLPIGCYKDPNSGKDVPVSERYSYDRAAQVSRIAWHYKLGRKAVVAKKLNMRCFYPQELDALLHYNSFVLIGKYGGYAREPFLPDSRRQVVVCRKAQSAI